MVDSGEDFLIPELINLIFFQQKSLVIFPYVDKKHLKSLETFAVGHSVIDLDCTVLNDVLSIIEHDEGSYSKSPSLFFIYNASKDIIASLHDRENVHCIINTHEDVAQLVSGHSMIFYNKKNKRCLNWKFDPQELEFEKALLKQSQGDLSLLQDLLVHIKSFSTRVYTALVETNNIPSIPILFNEQSENYPPEYWGRILEFMENYHDIKTPPEIFKGLEEIKVYGNVGSSASSKSKSPPLEDFSSEYELIIASDRSVSNAFIHELHEYRSNYVNSANLELKQLYDPRELYTYLRNHHWKEKIDEEFIHQWFKDPNLVHENNSKNVKIMLKKLGIPYDLIIKHEIQELKVKEELDSIIPKANLYEENEETLIQKPEKMPPIKNFKIFREWILGKLDQLESKESN
jgi:hypothetical protein